MRRLLCSLAVPASAVPNIEAPASYVPGQVIALTVTEDSEGATASVIRALLTVDPALTLVSGTPGVLNDSAPTPTYWAQGGPVGDCGMSGLPANQCLAVDAFEYIHLGSYPIDLLTSTLSTWQFDTTGATGDLLFSLDPDGAGFFGQPGTTATVAMVPERATALLLAAGLVGLAVPRPRESDQPTDVRSRA